jgi:hypothetical protein
MELYKSFLLSLLGGEWREEEITELWSPTRIVLLNLLRQIRNDYTFLTFSGHGYVFPADERTYVNLAGEDVASDYELISQSPRRTIIIDACRSYNPIPAPSPPPLQKLAEALTFETTRQIFDQSLSRAEKGTIILYSTGSDEAADSNEKGGFFTQSILNGARQWYNTTSEDVLDVHKAFVRAGSILQTYPGPQHPEIKTGRRNKMFPFAVRQPTTDSNLSLGGLVDKI